MGCIIQNCDAVVGAIKETGQIKRDQRDLEEQVGMRHAASRQCLCHVTACIID